MQREMAGDGESGGILLRGVGDTGGGESDAGRVGENGGRSVISVGVDGAAVVRAGGAREAPADSEIGFAAAGDVGVERLQGAEFDGRGNGRKRDGDVAGDGEASGGGFGGVGVTGGGDLYFSARRKICGGGEESVGRDGADLGRAAGDSVDAPEYGGVGGVGDGGGEGECVAEQHGAGIGNDGDGDLRRGRRWCGTAARAACTGGEGETEGE